MKDQVIYRKYRPVDFSQITGQGEIIKTLQNAVENDMVAHAYLFCGPRGIGKTSTARILAKAVNCLDLKGSEPCNKCANCLSINNGNAVDLVEIDAASNRGIDDIREIREGVKYAPTNLKYKVLIIDECHQLTKEASNAILKTLEEPPKHTIFILATTEIHKMLPTIISRCQRFDFRKVSVKDMVEKLEDIVKKEKIKISKPALTLIASNAQGSVRDAEVLLSQVFALGVKEEVSIESIKNLLGLVDIKVIRDFLAFLVDKDTKSAIQHLNDILDRGYDPNEFLRDLINYLRQALFIKIDKKLLNPLLANLTKEDLLELNEIIKKTDKEFLHKSLNMFLASKSSIKFSPIPQLPIELAIVSLIDLQKDEK